MKVKNNMRYRNFFTKWYFWLFFIIMFYQGDGNYTTREAFLGDLVGVLIGTWVFFALVLLTYRIIIKIFSNRK